MGCCAGTPTTKHLEQATNRVKRRHGPVQAFGRYHKLPRRFAEDYEMEEQVLGVGMSGAVRLARSKANHTPVAVKTLAIGGLAALQRHRLIKEVEIFLTIDHPNAVRLLDVYESGGSLTFVMELLSGGELFHRVQEQGRFSETCAAQALKQILLVVSYMHGLEIVHRDLKLHNFLYQSEGSPHLKLIDFGLGKFFKAEVAMWSEVGTLGYKAPEVLAHIDNGYTCKCDIWSVGIIAFNLLAGYMPFHGDAKEQLQMMLKTEPVSNGPKECWVSVSQQAKDFARSALSFAATDRPSALELLKHPWLLDLAKDAKTPDKTCILDGCVNLAKASRFRRACNQMLAWSLMDEEQLELLRLSFFELDRSNSGTITFSDFQTALMDQLDASNYEVEEVFKALDFNHNDTIYYSEFLAAMVANREMIRTSNLVAETFRRLDRDNKGYLTESDCQDVLGVNLSDATPKNSLRGSCIRFEDFEEYVLSPMRATATPFAGDGPASFCEVEV